MPGRSDCSTADPVSDCGLSELARFAEVPHQNRKRSLHEDSVARVISRLVESKGHLTEPEAAEMASLSERQFREVFREVACATFRVYRCRVKMDCARELLASDMPIREISDRLGYESRGKFERSFKQVHGQTPSQYRASEKNFQNRRSGDRQRVERSRNVALAFSKPLDGPSLPPAGAEVELVNGSNSLEESVRQDAPSV